MGSLLTRSVEIQICNKTQNITLNEPRTYLACGSCSQHPRAELSPGCSGTCSFTGDSQFLGLVGTSDVSGILVYEAESFTLAIHFYNPIDYDKFSMKLGLELSPGKAHLGDLRATYDRMADGIYSSSEQDIKFARIRVGKSLEIAHVSQGPFKVTATVSSDPSSRIKVVLEEERRWERNPF